MKMERRIYIILEVNCERVCVSVFTFTCDCRWVLQEQGDVCEVFQLKRKCRLLDEHGKKDQTDVLLCVGGPSPRFLLLFFFERTLGLPKPHSMKFLVSQKVL